MNNINSYNYLIEPMALMAEGGKVAAEGAEGGKAAKGAKGAEGGKKGGKTAEQGKKGANIFGAGKKSGKKGSGSSSSSGSSSGDNSPGSGGANAQKSKMMSIFGMLICIAVIIFVVKTFILDKHGSKRVAAATAAYMAPIPMEPPMQSSMPPGVMPQQMSLKYLNLLN